MIHPDPYPSKIMLAGEYGVVIGGSALTIPYYRFDAKVRENGDTSAGETSEAEISQKYLLMLFNYISGLQPEVFHAKPDLDFFSANLKNFWLEMNIPTGYGLGSSGAVSAAVYDLFFPGAAGLSLEHQREDLAVIESYFHGKSSGVDALTCHARTPLYFNSNGTIEKKEFDPSTIRGGYRLFLLDSEERFETGPLVKEFLQRMNDNGFASSIRNEYLVINQKLIESLLGIGDGDPALLIRVLSDYQFTHFRKMIPERMLDVWIEGQLSNEFYLKLNGSGGGYMLGITHETSMESLSERWKEKITFI
jgi:mevalonate kinase